MENNEYDIESMSEYIEDLETQLDEISSELKQRAKTAANQRMDDITAGHEQYGLGIGGYKGISPEKKKEWVKRNKQSLVFGGVQKPKVPRTEAESEIP